MSRVMDNPTPEKTAAEILDELCKKKDLKYEIKHGERKLIVLTHANGEITTGIGDTMREAVLNAASKLGD